MCIVKREVFDIANEEALWKVNRGALYIVASEGLCTHNEWALCIVKKGDLHIVE